MGMDVFGNEPKNEAGEYFRNNVWWWRPLWDFVASIDEIYSVEKNANRLISEEMYQSGHCNDGVGLETQEDCDELLNRLGWAIEEGLADHQEKQYSEIVKQAKETNKFVEKEMQEFQDKMKKKLGNDVVPYDYPKKDKAKWDAIYRKRDNRESYPFSKENVEEFCKFLENCGGFRIC